MIQDIAPHIYHNEYKPIPPTPDCHFFYFEGNNALVHVDGLDITFPRFQDYPEVSLELSSDLIYLFSIDEKPFYLCRQKPAAENPYFQMATTRYFRDCNPQWLDFAGITAHQLYLWYDSHHFCGHCGSKLVHSDKERMMQCPNCGLMEYPKISPAVIVGVIHNNKILMSKYAGRVGTQYALIAGFAEIGETIEETVHREVMEEVGLKVKNLHYYKSQPWSFSSTLLMGFFVELDGDDDEIILDTQELATAGWFTPEDAPPQSNNMSLTSEMIWQFKKGLVEF